MGIGHREESMHTRLSLFAFCFPPWSSGPFVLRNLMQSNILFMLEVLNYLDRGDSCCETYACIRDITSPWISNPGSHQLLTLMPSSIPLFLGCVSPMCSFEEAASKKKKE